MRSKESMLRLHRFKCEDKRRQVAEIDFMISDLENKVLEYSQQIEIEEKRAGISDPSHFNYPIAAKSIQTRKENIKASISGLKEQLEIANAELAQEEAEMRKIELLVEKSGGSVRNIGETTIGDMRPGMIS